jgi:hypothetical protein
MMKMPYSQSTGMGGGNAPSHYITVPHNTVVYDGSDLSTGPLTESGGDYVSVGAADQLVFIVVLVVDVLVGSPQAYRRVYCRRAGVPATPP